MPSEMCMEDNKYITITHTPYNVNAFVNKSKKLNPTSN